MSLSAADKQRRYRERNDAGQERRQNIFVKEKRKTPAWYSDMKKKTYFSCQKGQGELEERRKHIENIVTPSASPTHAIAGPSDASNSHQVTHRQLESLKNESKKKRKVAKVIQLSSY